MQVKKYRQEEQCFVVEGEKGVQEALRSKLAVRTLIAVPAFMTQNKSLTRRCEEVIEATPAQLDSLSSLSTNSTALAVVRIPHRALPPPPKDEFFLAVDAIRDPGNLGTLVRAADWFGIRVVLTSGDTADCYNPKAIQASMGSITRVEVHPVDLATYLESCAVPVLGAFLSGDDVHNYSFGREGIILVGNESRGISEPLSALVTQRITIPRYGNAESLNAAVAASIILDNLRRVK